MTKETFEVIKISRLRLDGYVDVSFFEGITTNYNRIQILTTNSVTDAMKVNVGYETDKVTCLVDFIKKFYPKKEYKISIAKVEINYD